MLSRKSQNDKEIPLPDTWCKELEETLNEVYREKSLDSQKDFFVQGFTYPNEVLAALEKEDRFDIVSVMI